MNKIFSLFILLSINACLAMQHVKELQKVPGSITGEFSYEAMSKIHGPVFDLTNESHTFPYYKPADTDQRFLGGRHPDYQDDTLHEAVRGDNVAEVTALLRSGKYPANRLNGWGSTPLFYVESYAMASVLVDHGADVNAVEQLHGNSPLHFLVQKKNKEDVAIVDLLLSKGAKVNALGWNYHTPLTMAKYGHSDMVASLISKGAEDSFKRLDCIHKAIVVTNVEEVD